MFSPKIWIKQIPTNTTIQDFRQEKNVPIGTFFSDPLCISFLFSKILLSSLVVQVYSLADVLDIRDRL